MTKINSWEGLAVELVYRDRDPVTIAVLPRQGIDLMEWMNQNIKRPQIGEHFFVYTYDVTVH